MRRAFTSVSENPAYDARSEESPRAAADAAHREAELHQARGAFPLLNRLRVRFGMIEVHATMLPTRAGVRVLCCAVPCTRAVRSCLFIKSSKHGRLLCLSLHTATAAAP